ncbi:hypothetical protein LXL04_025634 [Taraxacum kok-saghyz]
MAYKTNIHPKTAFLPHHNCRRPSLLLLSTTNTDGSLCINTTQRSETSLYEPLAATATVTPTRTGNGCRPSLQAYKLNHYKRINYLDFTIIIILDTVCPLP